MNNENNKRIAKNTLFLYVRMLLIMGVSLFTVRVVLDKLGTVDYGLYNVIGGVVVMASFLSRTMASASQRFFSFELGRKDYVQLKRTFQMTLTIYGLIALVILVLAETAGLWFINYRMTIPPDRLPAANWVYQFTILSFLMTMLAIPYNAMIIAHEKMNVYAVVSILEALLKLVVVYLLVIISADKLVLYSILIFLVTSIVSLTYRGYCKRKYTECEYRFFWDKPMFRNLLSYSGWNLIGSTSALINNEGINILLNLFFGPVVNAARGIAFQINAAINQFVMNFTTAVNPQIIKYYAQGEKGEFQSLVFRSSKLAFSLLFFLAMPVLLQTEFILNLWLKETPDYVVIFTRLVICVALIDSMSTPLTTSALATGKIRNYQLVVGGMMVLNLPVSYLFLKLGYTPEYTLFVALALSTINLFLRLAMLRKMIEFPMRRFLADVVLKMGIAASLSIINPFLLREYLEPDFKSFVLICVCAVINFVIIFFIIGLSQQEKKAILTLAKNQYNKFKLQLKESN